MKFIDLSKEDRADVLDRVSTELNIRQREVVEKDWWVTAVLRAIFCLPYAQHLSFKGGTSLSKCWHLIDRFSEDIDIAIDREYLGFSGTLSKTQVSDKLRRAACSFVRETMQHDIAGQLHRNGIAKDKFQVNVDITPISTTDPETININYDSVLTFSIDGEDGLYVLPKLSLIARQFLKESLTRVYGGTVVMVLSQLRTFTVFKVTSSTSPFIPCLSIMIQSPGLSMSWAESCTPATSPSMVSLKISISTAAEAPSPASSVVKSFSMSTPMVSTIPTQTMSTLTIW